MLSVTRSNNFSFDTKLFFVAKFKSFQIIQVTFPTFDIVATTNCAGDFLQIHDGNSASAHLIGIKFTFAIFYCLLV